MVYKKIPDRDIDLTALQAFEGREAAAPVGVSVDELNPFRRRYFAAFSHESAPQS
jgi:hypothetical protein